MSVPSSMAVLAKALSGDRGERPIMHPPPVCDLNPLLHALHLIHPSMCLVDVRYHLLSLHHHNNNATTTQQQRNNNATTINPPAANLDTSKPIMLQAIRLISILLDLIWQAVQVCHNSLSLSLFRVCVCVCVCVCLMPNCNRPK
jgi:hypothetical protein